MFYQSTIYIFYLILFKTNAQFQQNPYLNIVDNTEFQLHQNVLSFNDNLFNNLEFEEWNKINIINSLKTSFIPYDHKFLSNREKRILLSTNQTILNHHPNDNNETLRNILEENNIIRNYESFALHLESGEQIREKQANNMKKYIDLSVDPCEDFYQYACGNWKKYNQIPNDKSEYDTFEILRNNIDLVIRHLLTTNARDNNYIFSIDQQPMKNFKSKTNANNNTKKIRKLSYKKRKALIKILFSDSKNNYRYLKQKQLIENTKKEYISAQDKAKTLYESCMNSNILNERGIEPLLTLLKSLGGWPVLDNNWSAKDFNWLNLTAQLRLYNNDIFIVEWVGPDLKNSEKNIINLDQTTLSLPARDFYIKNTHSIYLKAYKEFIMEILILMDVPNNLATKTTKEILNFEIRLAKITYSSDDRLNTSFPYNRFTILSLYNRIPEIDWKTYLSIAQNRTVDYYETVAVYSFDYFLELVKLIDKTDSKIIANYLLWRFVRHRINNLDDRFQNSKQKFYSILFGRQQNPPRWKSCIEQVNSNMGMVIGSMFIQKYFDDFSKQDTLAMTLELQNAFKDMLINTDWLDSRTKYLAELKVNSMSLKIGYPDDILYQKNLDEIYKNLEFDKYHYFENILGILKFISKNEHSLLYRPVNKTLWQTSPAIVNAYYSRNKNQIVFPAGILQPPFYHRHYPKCINYGGIGVVIGHEITHGFDDKGRLFDGSGNIHKWWSEYSTNEFHKRSSCLVSQYSRFNVTRIKMNLDGKKTQGENIADNGGLKEAFLAYQNWLKRQNKTVVDNEKLVNLNLTSNQLFFLNFAQIWCGSMKPDALRSKIRIAVHSPGKYRVIGTLSNSEEFAKEFQCSVGSRMNPKKKCRIW